MLCKNCRHKTNGHYCSQCGQKTDTHRITFASILHDIPHSIFHVDSGLLYTLKELLVRPGRAIFRFVEGERVRHFKPLAYLFILTTIASYVSHLANREVHLKERASAGGADGFIQTVSPFFLRYPSIFFLIMIPLASLLTLLFFRKRGFNYWENVVLNTYLTAQFNLCLILINLYNLISASEPYSFTPALTLYFTYISFAYGQFFSARGGRPGFWNMFALIVSIVLLYITGFSLAGLMTPWWAF